MKTEGNLENELKKKIEMISRNKNLHNKQK